MTNQEPLTNQELLTNQEPITNRELMTNQERWQALSRSLDAAVGGLATFDAEGLEWLRHRVHTLTNEYRAQGLTGSPEILSELLRKHSLLQAVLNATAANLKVLETRRTNLQDRREETHGYLDLAAVPLAQRTDSRPGGTERDRQ